MRRPLLTPIHSTTSTSFSTPSSPESSSVRESDSAPTSPEHDSPPKLSITKLERASVAVEGIPCSPLPISELETAPDSVGGLADRLREATKEVHQAVMMPSIVQSVSPFPSLAIFHRKDAFSWRQRNNEADTAVARSQ